MKEKKERFELTLKGFFEMELGIKDGDKLYDSLELFMRRHYEKKGHAGIVLDRGTMIFITLEKQKGTK